MTTHSDLSARNVIAPEFRRRVRAFDCAVSHGITPSGTERFRVLREKGIGGSEIAAVMGLSPWASPFSTWHRKARPGSGFGETEQSEAMYWGTVDEPNIARRFGDLHPEYAVIEAPLYTSKARPWQIASPDRILVDVETGERSVLEIKTSRYDDAWRDGVPIQYRCQVLWYLDVLELDRAIIACRFGGAELREYEIERDAGDMLAMREAGAEFMRTLAAGEQPDLDGHTATYQTVKKIVEGVEDVDVEVSLEDALAYAEAIRAAERGEQALNLARSKILQAVDTGKRAVWDGPEGKITVATRTVRNGETYSLLPGKRLGDLLAA